MNIHQWPIRTEREFVVEEIPYMALLNLHIPCLSIFSQKFPIWHHNIVSSLKWPFHYFWAVTVLTAMWKEHFTSICIRITKLILVHVSKYFGKKIFFFELPVHVKPFNYDVPGSEWGWGGLDVRPSGGRACWRPNCPVYLYAYKNNLLCRRYFLFM